MEDRAYSLNPTLSVPVLQGIRSDQTADIPAARYMPGQCPEIRLKDPFRKSLR